MAVLADQFDRTKALLRDASGLAWEAVSKEDELERRTPIVPLGGTLAGYRGPRKQTEPSRLTSPGPSAAGIRLQPPWPPPME